MRDAVDKIIGAVDGINHPQTLIFRLLPQLVLALGRHLFAQHRAVDNRRQTVGKRRLRRQIGFGKHAAVFFFTDVYIQKARHHFGARYFPHQIL